MNSTNFFKYVNILNNLRDLVPLVTFLHGCFSRFFNWTNGTKSRKAFHMIFKYIPQSSWRSSKRWMSSLRCKKRFNKTAIQWYAVSWKNGLLHSHNDFSVMFSGRIMLATALFHEARRNNAFIKFSIHQEKCIWREI